MFRQLLIGLSALACCAATSSSPLVAELAGRYSRLWVYKQIGGDGRCCSAEDRVEDVVEIVPLSRDTAYFRLAFVAGDEGECGMTGVGHVENHNLIFRDPQKPNNGGPSCKISIERAGRNLRVVDKNGDDQGTCSRMYCGVHGSLTEDLPWSSKRGITYMAKLRASPEYRDAVAGRPASQID